MRTPVLARLVPAAAAIGWLLPRRPAALRVVASLPPLPALRCACLRGRCASITASPSAVNRHALTWRLVCALRVLDQALRLQALHHPRDLTLIRQADDLRHFAVVQTRTTTDRRQRHLRTHRQAIIRRAKPTPNGRRDRPSPSPSRRRGGTRGTDAPAPSPPPRLPLYGSTIVAINCTQQPNQRPGRSSSRRAWITPNVAPTTPSATSAGSTPAPAHSHDPRSTTPAKLSSTLARRASTRGPAASASTNTKRAHRRLTIERHQQRRQRRPHPRGPTKLRLPPRAQSPTPDHRPRG